MAQRLPKPSRDALFAVASSQEGLFTTHQAALAGYSPQLLTHHLAAGTIIKIRRGIYRLVHFPGGDHEDLVMAWLWSDQQGVLSHQSALSRHGLTDALPAHLHLTVPSRWQRRRVRIPPGVVLHFADLPAEDCSWFGPVPITTVVRTLRDCTNGELSAEQIHLGSQQALRRGLISPEEFESIRANLTTQHDLPV